MNISEEDFNKLAIKIKDEFGGDLMSLENVKSMNAKELHSLLLNMGWVIHSMDDEFTEQAEAIYFTLKTRLELIDYIIPSPPASKQK